MHAALSDPLQPLRPLLLPRPSLGSRLKAAAYAVCLLATSSTWAQLSALLVLEPTERKDGFLVSRSALEAGLGKALGQVVKVQASEDLTDAMRLTRGSGPDVFMAPPQVVASAQAPG